MAEDIAHTAQHTERAPRSTEPSGFGDFCSRVTPPELLYIWLLSFEELRLAMNAHLPVVRPPLCYARQGATHVHQKTEPSGPGHRTRNTTNRAGEPVQMSQSAQDNTHATHASGKHTGEQEPSGPGHRTRNTTH